MTDDTENTISFYTPGADSDTAPPLVAFADCELITINGEMVLVINRQNGKQQMLSPQVADGLKSCTEFRTIEDHAANLAAYRPELQGQEAMAIAALNSLMESGILMQSGDVCSRLAEEPEPRELPPTRVFITTCDRPAAVERLLESLLEVGTLSQHEALFLVDDSREPVNREANREAVAKFNLSSAREMYYVGEEAQQSLLAKLVGRLPQHEEGIRFLLDASCWKGSATYGRSRTLCLLLSVGCRALVMDDDVLCQSMVSPIMEEGLYIGSTSQRQAGFFLNEQAMISGPAQTGFDPLGGHASLLGSNLGQALQVMNDAALQPEQLLECNAAVANMLTPDSPVLITQNGTLGDPGTASVHWALGMGAATLQRLASAPQGVAAAVENRLNWLGATRPNIYKMAFMSQLTGLDNSRLLPPYFPAYRGEDVLFGAMLLAVHPHSAVLEFPWCIPHLPVEPRAFSVQDPIASYGDMALFAQYVTEQIDYRDTANPEQNLDRLARDLQRLSVRSDRDLQLDYRARLARMQINTLRSYEQGLAQAAEEDAGELQNYLQRGIQELQTAIASENSPTRIPGVDAGTTEAQLLDRFRGMADGFSRSLLGWAEVRAVAAELADDLIASRALLPE